MTYARIRATRLACDRDRAERNFQRQREETDTSSPNFGEKRGSEVKPFCPGWHTAAHGWFIEGGGKDLAQKNYFEE